jgi:ParB family chromosome partitioning protein
VDQILPNPWQPRRTNDPEKMEELVRSVQARGILEPLLVRQVGDTYELVAGERRLRAAQRIGMKEVPIIIVTVNDIDCLEIALIENLQREDLNPVDEARAYLMMTEEFGRTHDEIAARVGKDRSTVTNLLRLLRLPSAVLSLLADGSLTTGHARVLLGLDNPEVQERWARRIVDEKMSVREIEHLLARGSRASGTDPGKRPVHRPAARDPHLARVEEAVRRRIGSKARLHVNRRGGGRLELLYADQEGLERILDLLGVQVH